MKKILSLGLMLIMALSLAACSATAKPTATAAPVVLSDIYTEMTQKAKLPAMQAVTGSMILDYYGIAAADIKQSTVYISQSSILADEIAMFEAVDSDAAARIKQKLDARHDSKAEEANNYSPEQYAVIMKCPVVQNGNFVSLLVASDNVTVDNVYKEYIK